MSRRPERVKCWNSSALAAVADDPHAERYRNATADANRLAEEREADGQQAAEGVDSLNLHLVTETSRFDTGDPAPSPPRSPPCPPRLPPLPLPVIVKNMGMKKCALPTL